MWFNSLVSRVSWTWTHFAVCWQPWPPRDRLDRCRPVGGGERRLINCRSHGEGLRAGCPRQVERGGQSGVLMNSVHEAHTNRTHTHTGKLVVKTEIVFVRFEHTVDQSTNSSVHTICNFRSFSISFQGFRRCREGTRWHWERSDSKECFESRFRLDYRVGGASGGALAGGLAVSLP